MLAAFVAGVAGWSLACADATHLATQAKEAAVAAKEAASTPEMPCDANVKEEAPMGCLSGHLSCGDVIEGTTTGGDSNFDDAFYSAKFCFPAGDGHGGPERTYLLDAPAYTSIDLVLQSDCVDLDIAAIAYVYDGHCPSEGTAIPECEGENRRGGDHIRIQTFNNPREYLVAIDGKQRKTGTYRLSVRCQDIVRRE